MKREVAPRTDGEIGVLDGYVEVEAGQTWEEAIAKAGGGEIGEDGVLRPVVSKYGSWRVGPRAEGLGQAIDSASPIGDRLLVEGDAAQLARIGSLVNEIARDRPVTVCLACLISTASEERGWVEGLGAALEGGPAGLDLVWTVRASWPADSAGELVACSRVVLLPGNETSVVVGGETRREIYRVSDETGRAVVSGDRWDESGLSVTLELMSDAARDYVRVGLEQRDNTGADSRDVRTFRGLAPIDETITCVAQLAFEGSENGGLRWVPGRRRGEKRVSMSVYLIREPNHEEKKDSD